MRVSPWLLLLLATPVSAQDQPTDPLPDADLLEFLGSFAAAEDELVDLAFDAIEDETEQTRTKPIRSEENDSHDTH